MATNKHAIIRYQALDKCFRNPGRKYYMDDLIEACNHSMYEFTGTEIGIKKRQIFEDIKFMESPQGWNIPLDHIRDGHKVYYRYSNISFSINNQPLNETEENQLKEALLTLSRFKGMPQFEWVDEISARLDSGLGLSSNNQKIIEFEQNNFVKGLEFITPIYNATLYKQVIKIIYKSFRRDELQTFELHPYFLKQYNNRWFVFGLNQASDRLINLALDRILEISETKVTYKHNEKIDFSEYFDDIVGVTLDSEAELQHILLKVANTLIPYIETKPLHGSQKIKQRTTDFTLLSLDIIPNYELIALLLSYGDGIEVVEPTDFRKTITQKVKAMYKKYQ